MNNPEERGDDGQQPMFKLDRSTLVPIGLLVAVVLASITATGWIQKTLLTLEHKIDNLQRRVDGIAQHNAGQWTVVDMQAWAELLAARNANLHVPPTRKN